MGLLNATHDSKWSATIVILFVSNILLTGCPYVIRDRYRTTGPVDRPVKVQIQPSLAKVTPPPPPLWKDLSLSVLRDPDEKESLVLNALLNPNVGNRQSYLCSNLPHFHSQTQLKQALFTKTASIRFTSFQETLYYCVHKHTRKQL